MALPGSGIIKFSDLQTEFGGSNPISMSEYYRGGAYTTSGNTSVPTSGAISLSNFYGASAADLIPNSFDLANVSAIEPFPDSGSSTAESNTVTISGITEAINITIDTTDGAISGTLVTGSMTNTISITAYVNGSEAGTFGWSLSGGGGQSAISRTMTFSVPVNGTLKITVDFLSSGIGQGSGGANAILNVKNSSSSNTVLDTLQVAASASFNSSLGGGLG